ncbi:MAG: hypothetical protein WCB11_09470, partial [Terriglobales bacterium]
MAEFDPTNQTPFQIPHAKIDNSSNFNSVKSTLKIALGDIELSTHSKLWIGAAASLVGAQALVSAWLPRGHLLAVVSDVFCAL